MAKKAGRAEIVVPVGTIVTPQAVDDAKACGIAIVHTAGGRPQAAAPVSAPILPPVGAAAAPAVVDEVRRLVSTRLGATADPASIEAAIRAVLGNASGVPGPASTSDAPADDGSLVRRSSGVDGIAHVRQSALPQAAATARSGSSEAVHLTEAFPPTATTPGIGYMDWEDTSFTWTFAHAEVLVVLSGQLTLIYEGTTFAASAGDALHIAPGSAVTLAATGKVRCVLTSWPSPNRKG